jgi:hypothetical protein
MLTAALHPLTATHHACDEAPLLVVLLAKACNIWLHYVEQLGHNLQANGQHTRRAWSEAGCAAAPGQKRVAQQRPLMHDSAAARLVRSVLHSSATSCITVPATLRMLHTSLSIKLGIVA